MASKRKNSKEQRKVKYGSLLLPVILIVFGTLLIGYSVSRNFNLAVTTVPQEQSTVQVPENKAAQKIKTISVPKLEKNLGVEDGSFVNGRWEVSEDGVSYYTDSNLPQDGGNTVLYGHNKERILGGLEALKAGDRIDLTLEDGKILSYEVTETKTIKPTEVDILNQTENHRLTIYTCTGFLDSARFVVIAKPFK